MTNCEIDVKIPTKKKKVVVPSKRYKTSSKYEEKKTQVRNNCKNYILQFLPFVSITLGLKMEKLKKKTYRREMKSMS